MEQVICETLQTVRSLAENQLTETRLFESCSQFLIAYCDFHKQKLMELAALPPFDEGLLTQGGNHVSGVDTTPLQTMRATIN